MRLTLELHREDRPAEIIVIVSPDQRRFLSVRLAQDVTVYFPGFDQECAQAARQLAARLVAGADALEQTPAQPAEVA